MITTITTNAVFVQSSRLFPGTGHDVRGDGIFGRRGFVGSNFKQNRRRWYVDVFFDILQQCCFDKDCIFSRILYFSTLDFFDIVFFRRCIFSTLYVSDIYLFSTLFADPYSETDAATVMKSLFSAVRHLHVSYVHCPSFSPTTFCALQTRD
jgi:hypothetical protein